MHEWIKQAHEPSFADLIWSKPSNKQTAGKLLIIGGKSDNFSLPARAFEIAEKNGAGSVKVLLPSSLEKVAKLLPDVRFAPSNASGGFAASSLGEWLDLASWSDVSLLAGNIGQNSETTTLVDKFVLEHHKNLVISQDALTSCKIPAKQILDLNLVLVIDLSSFQKIGMSAHLQLTVTTDTPMHKIAEHLKTISSQHNAHLVIQTASHLWVASDGQVSSTEINNKIQNIDISTLCAIWKMQNPKKIFEALTTACYELSEL